MTSHVLHIDGRVLVMDVLEAEDKLVCHLVDKSTPFDLPSAPWPVHHYDHVYAWFNAIISDLRATSPKCIHLFDRQHVMTT